ncbi:hypothetical protein MKW94_006823 [Papaver nudicaule]|uniref:Bifunctional inhibitor/plant lipid transfer protein/seed storage helical domain-containing protein n=1 Tax=Papaver nudicaule TaxID=74823 RepID=A0AA41UV10_PAPNU|nr:hypothetical protein [Papaver nudicaule]
MARAISNNLLQLCLFLVLVSTILTSTCNAVPGCDDEAKALAGLCGKYVLKPGPKIPPSEDCCLLVRQADVTCACMHATIEVVKLISLDKVFYVADTCGRKIPPVKKCGSIGSIGIKGRPIQ